MFGMGSELVFGERSLSLRKAPLLPRANDLAAGGIKTGQVDRKCARKLRRLVMHAQRSLATRVAP